MTLLLLLGEWFLSFLWATVPPLC